MRFPYSIHHYSLQLFLLFENVKIESLQDKM